MRSIAPAKSSRDGSGGRSSRLSTPARSCVVRRVIESDLPHSLALGVLGLNGVTALIGLSAIGEPKAEETVLVSTAAGAVGSAVGRIAKILGCRAVGIAGGPEKVRQRLEIFGYDAAIDYKSPALGGDRQSLSRRRERLFRQHVRNHQRYGLSSTRGPGARGHLRRRLVPLLGPMANQAAHRTVAPCQARPRAGLRDPRLHGPLGSLGSDAGGWCAQASCDTKRTSWPALRPAPTRSRGSIAARTGASALSGSEGFKTSGIRGQHFLALS